jgi:hypothetical protein
MRRLLFVLVLVGAVLPARAQVGSADVPKSLPANIKSWEEFPSCGRLPPCSLVLANAAVEYNLYIDPSLQSYYGISHFRVRPTRATGLFSNGKDYQSKEVILWFASPAELRIFIKKSYRPAWGFGLSKRSWWVEISVLSPQARTEIQMAHRIWLLHTKMLEGVDPATLILL